MSPFWAGHWAPLCWLFTAQLQWMLFTQTTMKTAPPTVVCYSSPMWASFHYSMWIWSTATCVAYGGRLTILYLWCLLYIMVAVKYQYIFMVWACSGSHLHWAENFLYHQSQEGTLSPSSVPKPIIWLLMDWDWLLFTVECCAFIWVDSLGTENETGAALWSGNTTQPLCPVTLAWA